MGIKYNPFTGNFDFSGGAAGGAPTWTVTTATEAGMSVSGNSDGDAKVTLDTDHIWIWDVTSSRWVSVGLKTANIGSTPNAAGYNLTNTNVASNRTERTLVLQPADATYGGLLSTTTQTIAGIKTFNSAIYVAGGVDVASTGGTDTLTIGNSNADVINIGRSGATINIIGATNYQQVTDLLVTDKLITINNDGGVGSATGTGIEIEEDGSITGYFKTSNDRNSYQLLAPNTVGIITLTPGASGFTINQGSHDPVTLGSVGSSPNANGASLSSQVLTLQPADNTNPGVITTSAQTIAGVKTFSSAPNLDSLTASLPLKLDGSKNITSGAVSLSSAEVTGTLPIANGGTNSSTSLNNNRIIQSSSGSIVEAAVITANRALISDSNGIPTHSSVTNTELDYLSGVTSAVQTQLNAKLDEAAGDINETSFTANDNQVSVANVTAFAFANGTVRSFHAIVSIARGSTFQQIVINGVQLSSSWELTQSSVGQNCGLVFTITSAGQVQYTSTNTGNTATVKFRALTTSV